MANAVEPPLSVSNWLSTTSVVPERRRHSVEVIDVDLLDDEEIRTSQRPLQRRRLDSPELISLLDSDEDDQRVASGSGIRQGLLLVNSPSHHFLIPIMIIAGRQRLFSPPAPLQDNTIPPVPAVPREFSAHLSYPMHRRVRPFPSTSAAASGIVRPNTEPFSFETDIRTTGRRAVNHAIPAPLAAAPPSHHAPVMGLGGALVSSHRASETRIAQERQERDQEHGRYRQQHPTGFIGQARGILTAARRISGVGMTFASNAVLQGSGYDGDDMLAIRLLIADAEADDSTDIEVPDHPARAFAHQELTLRSLGRGRRREDVDYKPSYTHPGSPEQGFTFDFASPPSQLPSTSVSSPNYTSSSSNPIVIPDDGDNDNDSAIASSSRTGSQSGSSAADLNLSTLLVCARCLDPLVLGGGMTVGAEVERKRKVWGLRCGHLLDGKCLEEISRPSVLSPPLSLDVKGKGRAKVVEDASDDHDKRLEIDPDLNPIRSRLRPRTQQRSSTSNTTSFSPSSPPALRSHIKRKGKTVAPSKAKVKIEDKFEWVCPVNGCVKAHVSVKVGGVWGMDQDSVAPGRGRGAISLFV